MKKRVLEHVLSPREVKTPSAVLSSGRELVAIARRRKINLSVPQGEFLFHLPFPDADALTINEIMDKAHIDPTLAPEILDLVDVLSQHQVIEILRR